MKSPYNPCIECRRGRHVRGPVVAGHPVWVWICCHTDRPAPDPDPELTAAHLDERQKELPL